MATHSSTPAWKIPRMEEPGGLQSMGSLRVGSHGGSERPGKLEVGGASRDSTGFGALEEGLISS